MKGRRIVWAGWSLAVILALAGAAHGQTPAPSPAPAVVAERLPARDEVEQRIAAAVAELSKPGPVPPGIPAEEQADRETAVQLVERFGRRTVQELDRRAGLEAARAEAEAKLAAWTGFEKRPPYPILLVDWYRDARASARIALDNERAGERMIADNLDDLRAALQVAAQRARALQDRSERPMPAEEQARERWRLGSAKWAERAAAALLELEEVRALGFRAQVARLSAEHELLDRQCAALRGEVTFSAEDLARVRAGILAERERIDAELARASSNATAATSATAAAERALAAAGSSGDAAAAAQPALARAKARADTAEIFVASLRAQQDILDAEERIWQARFAFHEQRDDPGALRGAREDFERVSARIKQWRGFLRGKSDANAAMIAGETDGAVDPDGAGLAKEGAVREGHYRRVDLTLRRVERLVDRWGEEIAERLGSATLGEKAAGAADFSWSFVRRIWDFELFTAKEDVVVDGRTLAIDRGITVRKIVFAVCVLVAGHLLSRRIGRLVERVSRRRAGTAAGAAAALRNWVVAIGTVAAILVACVIAKIPLTLFAFLGGAFAIGLGFGTQTLMSNFISGLILLFERPVRVGDIVQIAGESGTVIEVGLRASTLRRADGVELVIPNRDFLEKIVANSTLSDRRLRYVIKVGVDYGSPTARVRDLLVATALEHGEVLRRPEPRVFFEDFAADALLFGLYYWVDLSAVPDPRVVASDLRFMIDGALREAGIGISFPQREVHLHTPSPIEVRMAQAQPVKPDPFGAA